jgi:hypothetical protein
MKIDMDELGSLVITPETTLEAYAIHAWMNRNRKDMVLANYNETYVYLGRSIVIDKLLIEHKEQP